MHNFQGAPPFLLPLQMITDDEHDEPDKHNLSKQLYLLLTKLQARMHFLQIP
jgi:hypothetical protein